MGRFVFRNGPICVSGWAATHVSFSALEITWRGHGQTSTRVARFGGNRFLRFWREKSGDGLSPAKNAMPKKITLTVEEAEAEMATLSELIVSCKDMAMRNRHSSRRSRLARHVALHSNVNKASKQALVIVHLRSQVHILRGMLMAMGVNVPNLDRSTGPSVTGVDGLGMQQEWLDEMAPGSLRLTYESVMSSTKLIDRESSGMVEEEVSDSEDDSMDELQGVGDDGEDNDIESLMKRDKGWNEASMLDGSL